MAVDRTPFHKQCVKCKQCGKGLNSATLNEHGKQLYCKPCYENVFVNAVSFDLLLWNRPWIKNLFQTPHSGSYGGIVTPEDLLKREEEEKKRLAKLERQKHERRCPKCDMKAFPEDSVKLSDTFFHKALKYLA